MRQLLGYIKKDIIGYVSLALMCWIIFGTHLVGLLIFLLFVYLLTDVLINDLRKWIPFVPQSLILWLFYIFLLVIFLFFVFRVIPLFFADVSHYSALLKNATREFLAAISHKYGINIDAAVLREKIFAESARSVGQVIRVFNDISKNVIYFIFALVLNFLLFHEKDRIREVFTANKDSLLNYVYQFVYLRVNTFYSHFRKVMGGQVVISFINLLITSVVVYLLHLPNKITLLFFVFIFGLIPVVGNLISNTILTITALIAGGLIPSILCLAFLIAIHKLEYFLNSKIVGSIIRLPMFITLMSLLLGEAILGIWGIIIAIPVVLTIKDEMEQQGHVFNKNR